jgi:NAD(P)-dependent dehydrogenase (short-subunit alcohol dehydrogenase family)
LARRATPDTIVTVTTILITGANRGIGLALAAEAANRGMHVIATCRQSSTELAALSIEVIEDVDLTTDTGIATLAAKLAGHAIDILINNAGVTARESLAEIDAASIRHQFEVNSLAPLRITHALMGNLNRGAKVAILGSRAGALSAVTTGGRYAYRMSKAAAHMAGVILAHDLKRREIGVYIVYPGYVATRMMNWQGIAPAESARQLLDCIARLRIEDSGKFLNVSAETLSW